MREHARIVGVDVSKAYLDLADTRSKSPWRIANGAEAIANLTEHPQADPPDLARELRYLALGAMNFVPKAV